MRPIAEKLAGYIRVSHVGGRSGDRFHSPDDQATEIKTWAKAHGRNVELLPPELDAKGSDPNRPTFRRAIDGVATREYAGVVVAYLSRAGRDLRLMLDLWDEVDAAGGTFYFARENIDTSTVSGRFQRNLLATVAQHELEERREGFERARAGAVRAGIWQRRQTPRGYRRNKTTRRLVVDRNADSVRAAFRDFLADVPIATIAQRLGMTTSGVRALLRNRVYLGELKVGKHVNPAAHPPLLDVETFEAAQHKLENGVRPARNSNGPALLAGLVRCAACGHVMTRGNSNGVPTYTCPARHSGEHCPAPSSIMTARLDSYAEQIALAELDRLEVTASAGRQIEAARKELAAAEAELDAYIEGTKAAGIGARAFGAGARKREDAVEAAKARLHAAMARNPLPPEVGSGAEAWPKLTAHDKNTLLRGLFAAVVVRQAGRGKTLPADERARVLAYGSEFPIPARRGGVATGIAPIPFPDRDHVGVLSIPASENGAQDARSVV